MNSFSQKVVISDFDSFDFDKIVDDARKLQEDLKSEMAHIGKKLVESRIISTMDKKPSSEAETSLDDFKVDYLEKFRGNLPVRLGTELQPFAECDEYFNSVHN